MYINIFIYPLKTWSHGTVKHTKELGFTISWDQVFKGLVYMCMHVYFQVYFCFIMLFMDVLYVYCMHI